MSFLDPDHHTQDGRAALVTRQAEINPDDPDWQRVYADIRNVISKNRADTAYLTSSVVLDEFLAHLPAEIIEAVWFRIRYTYKIADPLLDEDISEEEEYTMKDAAANLAKFLEKRGEEK